MDLPALGESFVRSHTYDSRDGYIAGITFAQSQAGSAARNGWATSELRHTEFSTAIINLAKECHLFAQMIASEIKKHPVKKEPDPTIHYDLRDFILELHNCLARIEAWRQLIIERGKPFPQEAEDWLNEVDRSIVFFQELAFTWVRHEAAHTDPTPAYDIISV